MISNPYRYYTPESRFRVLRAFTMEGVSFGIDDPFPGHRFVEEGRLDARRLSQMFEARIIDTDNRDPEDIPPEPVMPEQEPEAPAGEPAATDTATEPGNPPAGAQEPAAATEAPQAPAGGETAPAAADGAAAPAADAPAALKLKNGGFGRWYVATEKGENVSGPYKSKAEAEAALAAAK